MVVSKEIKTAKYLTIHVVNCYFSRRYYLVCPVDTGLTKKVPPRKIGQFFKNYLKL